MAKINELEEKIQEIENQLKSIKIELVKSTDLRVLKNEILDETRKESWLRSTKVIAIVTFGLIILGFAGYESINTSIINEVSKQILFEGRKRLDTVEIVMREYQENLKIIDKIEGLIYNGNKLFGSFDQNKSLAYKDFVSWKLEVASFVESLDLTKDTEYEGRKMSQLMARISYVHQKEGDNYFNSINQTNSILKGYMDFLKIKSNPKEKILEK